MATCNLDDLARDPTRLFRREKHDGISNVLWLPQATHRNRGHDLPFDLAGDPAGLDRPRRHSIHGDAERSDFDSDAARQRLERGLTGSVPDLRSEGASRIRAHVDDSARGSAT